MRIGVTGGFHTSQASSDDPYPAQHWGRARSGAQIPGLPFSHVLADQTLLNEIAHGLQLCRILRWYRSARVHFEVAVCR